MTGKEILNSIVQSEISIINISENNINKLNEIINSLKEFQVLDYFHQLKKDDSGDGLACEIMMFDKQLVVDLVISRNEISFSTMVIKAIKKITLDIEKEDENSLENILKFRLCLLDKTSLFYNTDLKRLPDILRIKNNLLNLL
jgi:hypothetical protein